MKADGPIFSTIAVPRTGNRGSVAMLESAIDHLSAPPHNGRIHVFSYYPKIDKTVFPRPGVDVLNGTPANLAFKLVPLSFLYRLAKAFRLPIPGRVWGKEMGALLESDVILLIGGTTFKDDKFYKVPWNVACVLPGIFLGKKQMMYSQTLGPFTRFFNRVCAKFCFSFVNTIVPRGEGSLKEVYRLGFPKARYYADSAFTLQVPGWVEIPIRERYGPMLSGKRVVGISVNSIVEAECRKLGIDHTRVWAAFITWLREQGYFIMMIPHSMRQNSKGRHNNDLLTVSEIMAALPSHDDIAIINEPYSCQELRVVVGLADYYIASRFHSMISALCTHTPVLVFGWGYQKYREVMAEFELEDYCFDAAEFSTESLMKGFERLVSDASSVRERIARNLPRVQESSMQNHLEALRLARD